MTGSRGDAVLVLQRVRHFYRQGSVKRAVLRGVNLTVDAGEAVGIHGPSGSGKSTLLRIASGWELPNSGDAMLAGRRVWRKRAFGRRVRVRPSAGLLMSVEQDPMTALDPRWSIARSMAEPLLVGERRPDPEERRFRVRQQLESMGLGQLTGAERPGQLSIGQCQRIVVGRALIAAPQLLLADEPTSALDVISRLVVARQLRTAVDQGVGMLIVSHDVNLLESVCDRVLEFRDGTVHPQKALR